MEQDVVCGMQVDPAKAAGTSEYNGKTVLLLLERLQNQVRRESGAVCEVTTDPGGVPNLRAILERSR